MDLETLRATLEQATLASLVAGLLTGLLFSFNPVALAAIPVSLAYTTRARAPASAVLYGAMFILGMLLTHAILGFIAGLGGQWVAQLFGRGWGLVLGPLLILLGMIWAGWIRVPLPALPLRARRATNVWGAFVLGVPFSVAVCPFCTPVLLVLLGVSAGIGSAVFGTVLLLSFALGRAVPIIIGAAAVGWLQNLSRLGRHQHAVEIAGGVVLILAGLYLLNAYFLVVPALAV